MNELLLRRRALMMATREEYIQDGLVLWMDGVKKGNISGAWVDQANGEVFAASPNVIFNSNNIELDGSSWLENTSFTTIDADIGTIEVCYEQPSLRTGIIFMPKDEGLAFGLYNNTAQGMLYVWTNRAAPNQQRTKQAVTSPATVSINKLFSIGNWVPLNNQYLDRWSGATETNYIGKRASGTNFFGKIYAIRIYSHQLKESEILHNQRLDNKRFNLGLNI